MYGNPFAQTVFKRVRAAKEGKAMTPVVSRNALRGSIAPEIAVPPENPVILYELVNYSLKVRIDVRFGYS